MHRPCGTDVTLAAVFQQPEAIALGSSQRSDPGHVRGGSLPEGRRFVTERYRVDMKRPGSGWSLGMKSISLEGRQKYFDQMVKNHPNRNIRLVEVNSGLHTVLKSWSGKGERERIVDPGIAAPRTGEKTYRVEFLEPGRRSWSLFRNALGKADCPGVDDIWEKGEQGGFVYSQQARLVAEHRSKGKPVNTYRVTVPTTKRVVAVYREGERIDSAPDMSGVEEGEPLSDYFYRAEFYQSKESIRVSGPGTGVNAPTPDPRKWWRGGPTSSRSQAEATYEQWTTKGGGSSYKRCRVIQIVRPGVEQVILDSAGNYEYEGDGTTMNVDTNPVREPLTVPRTAIIGKLEESQQELKDRHDKAQKLLAEDNAARMAKVAKVAADPWLVQKLIEGIFGQINGEWDEEKVYKLTSDHFGREPGTIEYVNDKKIEKLLSVLNIATDDNLKVLPGDDVYSYL